MYICTMQYMQKGNLIFAFSKNIILNWKTEIVDWCVKCRIVSFRVTTNIVIYVQYSCQILLTSFPSINIAFIRIDTNCP